MPSRGGLRRRANLIFHEPDIDDRIESTRSFNQIIDQYQDRNIDLIVSLVGLPLDNSNQYQLEELNCFDWERRPLFAADLRADYDPGQIRTYIEQGLLTAAVLFTELTRESRLVITADNLEQLPRSSPAID